MAAMAAVVAMEAVVTAEAADDGTKLSKGQIERIYFAAH